MVDTAAAASKLVSHYLDHIQPQIDDLARREKHLFQGLDPEALPEECAVGEHSLARMHCFQRFQRSITTSKIGEGKEWHNFIGTLVFCP
eukprot:symbB.v1.2.024852.t1/scaffold2376.1/size80753/7